MATRFQIAKPDIVKLFDSFPTKVFKRSDLQGILDEYRAFWRLPQSTSLEKFIKLLTEQGDLKSVKFEFPGRSQMRFIWKEAPILEMVQSLKEKSYFTHYTAVFLNELTEQSPTTIFLNWEQPPKRWGASELVQKNIDYAFRNKARISHNIAKFGDHRVCLLNGRFTGNLGIAQVSGTYGENIRVTDLERTLIDITVRPFYCGGVGEVLNIYRNATPRASIIKLADMLRRLDFIYPYHQAIGFYLERTGNVSPDDLALFEQFERKNEFYLTNKMGDMAYSQRWRLYFPKGL